MQLAIITSDGRVFECVDDLEEYDLDKTMARQSIIEQIQIEFERLKDNGELL